MSRRIRLALAGLLATCVGCGSASSVRPGDEPASPVHLDTRVVDRDGQSHDFGKILASGERIALVFWQSWCGPCRREAPAIAHAAEKYRGSIRFFGVVSGPDEAVDETKVQSFIDHFGLTYPQIRDRDLKLTRSFDVLGTPTIVVLEDPGRVIYRGHTPPEDWNALLPSTAQASGREPVLRTKELWVMGTPLTISALGEEPDELVTAIDAAVAELERIEDLMTDWRASPLTRLNDAAGKGPQPVDPELARLIARGQRMHDLTRGAFDISYAAVGRLWDFKADPPMIPSNEAIEAALPFVDASRIRVDLEANTVDLPEGMVIGLGGIAKGYGVDRAMKVLRDRGIEHAIVNAGGDMKILGDYFGRSWQVAIKHPRAKERVLAALELQNTCLVTSGDYERFFEVDGHRYHHILDPRTGRPSESAISASVIAPDAAFADALATALCILDPEEGVALVETLPGVEAIVVDPAGDLHISTGLKAWARNEGLADAR